MERTEFELSASSNGRAGGDGDGSSSGESSYSDSDVVWASSDSDTRASGLAGHAREVLREEGVSKQSLGVKAASSVPSWQKPDSESTVVFRFEAREMDSERVFDSTRDDEPLRLGPQSDWTRFPRAIRKALTTMHRGERARFTLQPKFGFGATAPSAFGLGPDAALVYDIELADYFDVDNITSDGGVKKTVVRKSSEYDKPSEGATVIIRYSIRLPDGTMLLDASQTDASYVVGSADPFEGLDLALESMHPGERAIVTLTAPYALLAPGREAVVPRDTTVELDLELMAISAPAKAVFQQSQEEKLDTMAARKERGNALFARRALPGARKAYRRALQTFHRTERVEPELVARVGALRTVCLSNMAEVALADKTPARAVRYASAALAHEPANVKALMRRARAYELMGEHESQIADLERVVQLVPGDKGAAVALARARKAESGQRERARAVFSKMFA